MEIIPGINCSDFECVKKRWNEVVSLKTPPIHQTQIDVADGKFAPVKTWNNPSELAILTKQNPEIAVEIHLMAENPDAVFEDWLKAGAKKIAVHIESTGNLLLMQKVAKSYGAELVFALNPTTKVEKLAAYLEDNSTSSVQFLTVSPGFSGQKFMPEVLEKIKFLRSRWPNVKIRVDGGMNPETAGLAKEAGADAVVAVSYIWGNNSPKEAYKKLLEI